MRFKDVAYKDLQPRVASPEAVSRRFRMQTLNEFYYSWGPSVADVNRDGTQDIVAGPYYYLGPDYAVAREIYVARTFDPGTQYFNGLQFAYDFTGDGWPDVINSLFTQPTLLYVNPKGESRRWDVYTVTDRVSSELALLKDVDGDGRLDYIFKDGDNRFVYANPDPANPTGTWVKHPISEPGPWANHGMGVGDVNKDGRARFPERLWLVGAAGEGQRREVDVLSGRVREVDALESGRRRDGGLRRQRRRAQRRGDDAAGARLGTVLVRAEEGGRRRRVVRRAPDHGDFSTKNAGGVTFSQLHGSTVADIDGDGLPDFITGKRFWSHLDTYLDPDPHGAPVLYVYRTVRNPKAPGGAEFVPELIHNRSGIGSTAAVFDLNKDGALDIITSTRRGTFIFWNNWKKPAPATSAAR